MARSTTRKASPLATHNTEEHATALDRAHGCLAGVALGDAMGMPGELWPRARVVEHFGWIDSLLPGPDGHEVVDGFPAARVTDDTEQTYMLAEAILANGGVIDAAVVAEHLVAWADASGATEKYYLGPASLAAIKRLREGMDPRTTGKGGVTNGATMRIAPVGLIRSSDDLDALVDAVVEAVIMSHDTSIAISGASLVAAVIAAAIDHPSSVVDEVVIAEVLEVGYRAAKIGESRGDAVVAGSIVERSKLAVEIAHSAASDQEFLQRLYDIIGASTATSETVPAAVGLLVRGGADPERVAILGANLGGDTDTIGSIATGMAGALSGISSISRELMSQIESVNQIDPASVSAQLMSHRV